MRYLYASFIALIVCALSLNAQTQRHVVSGVVVDSTTGEPIPGTSIRIEGTNSGTYARSGGRFRLPISSESAQLRVRSVGYHERLLRVRASDTNVRIALSSASVALSGVKVVADITPEEVIRRAIQRKQENASRIQTLISTTYSKMKFSLDMGGLDGKKGPDNSITETFSRIYDRRGDAPKKHVRILQRRQTANIRAGDNMAVFDDFFDFTEDEVVIIRTRLVTPLGKNALSEYRFTEVGKKLMGNQMVYELAFEPRSRLFPGFEGVLTIVEGTYQVIAANFRPTDETAFPFLKGLTYEQRYDRVSDSIWVPTFQNVSARAKVAVVKGLVEISADVAAQTYVTDVEVNVPIADSLLSPPVVAKAGTSVESESSTVTIESNRTTVTVDSLADSTRSEYWEQHAFAEPTEEERTIYAQQDSVAKAGGAPVRSGSNERRRGSSSIIRVAYGDGWSVGVDPMIDRSAITGMLYGGTVNIEAGRFDVALKAGFGQQGTQVGSAEARFEAVRSKSLRLGVFGSVMSDVATIQGSRTILRRLDFLHLSNLLYTDNFDFFRKDGYELGFTLKTENVQLAMSGEHARHVNMPVVENVDRTVIKADPGDYQMLSVAATLWQPNVGQLILGDPSPITLRVNGLLGRETQTNIGFWSADVAVDARIPTFSTGYVPMELDVTVHGGIQSTAGPIQTRFSVARRFPFLGSKLDFSTVGINNFAGTEFLSVVSEHNFSDLWWRAIGLPTFTFGRGVDIIGRFAAINVTQRATAVVSGLVYDSTPGVYMEAGFAVGRIPTFVSDLFWLRFDAMWPVGPLSNRGSFGWAITLSSPLL